MRKFLVSTLIAASLACFLTGCAPAGPVQVISGSQVAAELTKAGFIDCEAHNDGEVEKVTCGDSEDSFNRLYFYLHPSRVALVEFWSSSCPADDNVIFNFGDNWLIATGGGSWGPGREGQAQVRSKLQNLFGGELSTKDEILCS